MFDMLSYFHLGPYSFESLNNKTQIFKDIFKPWKKDGEMELHLLNFGSGKHFKIMFSVFKRPGKLIVQKVNHSVKQEKKK